MNTTWLGGVWRAGAGRDLAGLGATQRGLGGLVLADKPSPKPSKPINDEPVKNPPVPLRPIPPPKGK